ncbi:MAG TPA: ABC transporter permease [Candidatus Deferrimicrobiaceae bacterium]|jgi:tungstate transport system permease protein
MGFIGDGLREALVLLAGLDPDVIHAAWTSLVVSVWAVVIASLAGIPLGLFVGVADFPLRRQTVMLLNSLLGIPTVLVGLLLFGFLSRQGPLGAWGILFTREAIILGDALLAVPIMASYTLAAVAGADPAILETASTLGAGPLRGTFKLASEIRYGIVAAVIAGFGRVISEVGVAMMLGGNIRGVTRTMTTAIALESGKGNFAFGVAIGALLLAIVLVVNIFLNSLQQQRSR